MSAHENPVFDELVTWLVKYGGSADNSTGAVILTGLPKGKRLPSGMMERLGEYRGDLRKYVEAQRAKAQAAQPTPTPLHIVSAPARAEELPDWEARLTRLAAVKAERVQWVWYGRIPQGKLTVIDGDPGDGKSTFSTDIAARISTGNVMPDGSASGLGGPCDVLLLSAEDDAGDTIRPRVDAAGGDAERITIIECAVIAGTERERSITLNDVEMIGNALRQTGAKLMIVDPLVAYLDPRTNSYRDQDMRGVLAPLARLAGETGAAILAIRHLSKGASAKALYRGGGSIGIIGAARAGMLLARNPDDPDGPGRILAQTKSNVGAFPPSMALHIEEAPNGASLIIWDGTSTHTAASLSALPTDDESRSELDNAKDFLRIILADGVTDVGTARAEAKQAGVSDRTLDRAKRDIGVRSTRNGFGKGAVWFWSLPDNGEQS